MSYDGSDGHSGYKQRAVVAVYIDYRCNDGVKKFSYIYIYRAFHDFRA